MMKSLRKYTFISIVLLFCVSTTSGQTTIHGKMLSVDGRSIPKTIISIHQQNPRDIFSGYEDSSAEPDGSYSITLLEPGLYNITFRGIYHLRVSIPFLIIDQESIEMDLLMIPGVYNDGRYFENEEYLEWIRVIGNFNNYDVLTGIPFNLNDDGSISAFIPVTSDTIRYQVSGLGYGRLGVTPLPPADEYAIRENRSFESVLYRNLPSDSLEIRYSPDETIPFQSHLPFKELPDWLSNNHFINFVNKSDRYWVEPIHLLRNFRINLLPVLKQDLKFGLTPSEQERYSERFSSVVSEDQLKETIDRIRNTYYRSDIHPQQKAILSLSYLSLLHHVEVLQRLSTQESMTINALLGIGRSNENNPESDPFENIEVDHEILLQIPNRLVPTHPVLNQLQILSQSLLNMTNNHPKIVNFYHEIVKHHMNESTVERFATVLISEQAGEYERVDQIEVYQIIVDRFGEGYLARRSHEAIRLAHLQE